MIPIFASIIVGFLGQLLNREKKIPSEYVKPILMVLGIPFYIWYCGCLPTSWWGPEFEKWAIPAVPWIGALPGFASAFGTLPGMKTDSRGEDAKP